MATQEVLTLRLTTDNIAELLLPGDVFTDDPEFGKVVSARADRTGRSQGFVTTDRERDVLGLPQTVRITRTVHETVYPKTPGQRESK